MKKAVLFSLVFLLALIPQSIVLAGGDDDQAGEVEQALEDQIYRTRELEDKVSDLENQINDLQNRPPQIIEKETVIQKETVSDGLGEFKLPIHGFFNVNIADTRLEGADSTFDQENFALQFDYPLDENYRFFGEIGTKHGTEIDVDLNTVSGVGEFNVVEAWLDWKQSNSAWKRLSQLKPARVFLNGWLVIG